MFFKFLIKSMTSRGSFFSYLQPFTYAIFSLFCMSYPCLAQDRSSSVVALAELTGLFSGLTNFASGVVVNLPNNQVVIITARHSFDGKEKRKSSVNVRLPVVREFDSLPQTIRGGVIPPERLRLITSENADFSILLLSDQDSELIREYSVSQNPTKSAVDALQVMGYPGSNPDGQGEAIKLVTVEAVAISELVQCKSQDDASINYRQRQPSGRLFQAGMSGGGVFDAQGNWVGIHLGACEPDPDTPSGSEGSAMSADDIFTWINKENQFGNIQFNESNDAIRESNETNRITQPHEEVLSDFLETEVSPDLKQPIGGQW